MESAQQRWSKFEADVSGLLSRAEKYAALTLPYLFPDESYNTANTELQYDWQSHGAQCVNTLANKLMLTMFPPGRTFFRAEITDEREQNKVLEALDIDKPKLQEILAVGERKAIRAFESVLAARANLLMVLKQLIVVGNVALDLGKDGIEVHTLRDFRCRRDRHGRAVEIILRYRVKQYALEPEIQSQLALANEDAEVDLFHWYVLEGKRWKMSTWANNVDLGPAYAASYSKAAMPIHVLTWELPSRQNYGIGYVEQYIGDFAVLSSLSQAEVDMAIQAAQFRWVADPAGATRPEDLENSENGSCIPGTQGSISMVSAGRPADLQQLQMSMQTRTAALSRAFLLGSSVVRQAERVTAEEIRTQMDELETALGGTYSRLGQELQMIVADWALKLGDVDFGNSKIKPVIVTGLDGLSRSMETNQLRAFLQDVVSMASLPEPIQAWLKLNSIFASSAAGHGLTSSEYVATQEEHDATLDQAAQRQAAAQMAVQQGMTDGQ